MNYWMILFWLAYLPGIVFCVSDMFAYEKWKLLKGATYLIWVPCVLVGALLSLIYGLLPTRINVVSRHRRCEWRWRLKFNISKDKAFGLVELKTFFDANDYPVYLIRGLTKKKLVLGSVSYVGMRSEMK